MVCGKKCEVYSRVCGYHNPLQTWNKGQKEQFEKRLAYDVNQSLNSLTNKGV